MRNGVGHSLPTVKLFLDYRDVPREEERGNFKYL